MNPQFNGLALLGSAVAAATIAAMIYPPALLFMAVAGFGVAAIYHNLRVKPRLRAEADRKHAEQAAPERPAERF